MGHVRWLSCGPWDGMLCGTWGRGWESKCDGKGVILKVIE